MALNIEMLKVLPMITLCELKIIRAVDSCAPRGLVGRPLDIETYYIIKAVGLDYGFRKMCKFLFHYKSMDTLAPRDGAGLNLMD